MNASGGVAILSPASGGVDATLVGNTEVVVQEVRGVCHFLKRRPCT